jgi:ATP-dependent helicase/nuclease subunit B
VTFPQFFADLVGAIEVSSYLLPVDSANEAVLVADVVQARGLSFQAVAVLGLAEGEFPTTLSEDPLLRDADRLRLQKLGLPLNLPTDSSEVEFFYETITRPRRHLLLTRPRLADNGAEWKASPFWEETQRLTRVTPITLVRDSTPLPAEAASWPEFMESLSFHSGYEAARAWRDQVAPDRAQAQRQATHVLCVRGPRAAETPFNGSLGDACREQFGSLCSWSASRLEDYHACPFMFFVKYALTLAPREEPGEGVDVRQLGNIYHRLLAAIYEEAALNPGNIDELLEKLPAVAAPILDEAPEEENFRATAMWAQTRQTILEDVWTSLVKLTEIAGDFTLIEHEVCFFDTEALILREGDDYFRLSGRIDRVDQTADGTIRIIDYKTSGPSSFDDKAMRKGKKLQLPLYALAARDALHKGEPVDGFYWHIRQAERSPFSLQTFKDGEQSGPAAAMNLAVGKAWEAVRGARAGQFTPRPPSEGCPSYCPAAAFCWHYRPRFGG